MTSEPLPPPFRRFGSTVPHYLAGRPNYAPSLIRIVKERLHLSGRHRLLDLGCGPGWLAIAFAPFVGAVVGMDPEPTMLAAAHDAAAKANVQMELIEGSSYDSWLPSRNVPGRDNRACLSLDGPRRRIT
jgi:tRNA/tmRNA/rRNA uracil-C5-methylase (TrmA/RlmC/RlmD family)